MALFTMGSAPLATVLLFYEWFPLQVLMNITVVGATTWGSAKPMPLSLWNSLANYP